MERQIESSVAVAPRLRDIRPNFGVELAMGQQSIESNITSVTVFRSGALVTRMASLPKLDASRVKLVGLPLSLDDSTVRCRVVSAGVSGADKGKAQAIASEFKVVLDASDDLTTELRPEAKELKDLRLEIKQLRARARILREGLAYQVELGIRATSEKGQPPIASPLEARLALLEFSDKYHHSLYDEHHAVQEKIEVAQRRLKELEVAEQRASSAGNSGLEELHKSVVAVVQGTLSKDTKIELQYFVPGACWAPAYGLRIREDLNSAELTMRAMVSQRTGEDWTGVQVTLSTAELQRWAELPELKSKRIGRKQPQAPKRGWRPPPAGSEDLYRDYDNSFVALVVPPSPVPSPEPEAALFGAVGGAVTMTYPVPDVSDDEDFSSFDEEEHTSELLDSMLVPPPAPMAAAGAPPPLNAPRGAGERSRRAPAKKMAQMMPQEKQWEDDEYADEYADDDVRSNEGSTQVSEPDSSINVALLDYASLRLRGPGSMERGSLQLTSRTSIYIEYLADRGIKEEDELCQRLLMRTDIARENAMDIASLPSQHTLAWADDYDYAFAASSSLDIVSDGQFHSVPIMVGDAKCSSQHVVVPRETSDVFRTLLMNNCFSSPLLPGPMDVYWNENFLLTSPLSFTPPSGKVELGLGVDQAIKVVRNTHYREDTTGLMGGSLQLTHKIAIEVVNNSSRKINLRVQERIPVASSDADDIKVTVKNVTPSWDEYAPEPESAQIDALQGGYQWKISIPPGERSELSASYEIRLPSKFELRGGNRREW